ncbi:hypothetical protein RhiirA4_468085 [Rhizophagus irregularis]|uniref:Uncharacterized protein n=1 Tax=Rhizophagus irregularis TaxID=588596 RepID=A0A2I1GX39_9GLOM|nr:hypothetical protein RhiirA4_468085 [Rhizophagus irregularis]
MQSINSLREFNSKLLVKITKLKKKNAEIPELRLKFAEIEIENARLKQIIKENARHNRTRTLLKKLRSEFSDTNDEEAMPVVTVLTVDVPDSIIDQINNEVERAPSDLDGNDKEMIDFLSETYKKSISNKIRKRRWKKNKDNQWSYSVLFGPTKIAGKTRGFGKLAKCQNGETLLELYESLIKKLAKLWRKAKLDKTYYKC